jgi:hypothetical protein
MTARAVSLAAALVVAAAIAQAADAAQPILLPSVRTVMTPGPPLRGSTIATSEIRVLPGTTSKQRVDVGIDPTGKAVSLAVVQRLRISRLGDYTFAVPAPVVAVAGAPGTDSEPGLRRNAIVWAGFSPGTKILAARAKLRPSAAASLPLRLTVSRDGDTMVVRGEDVTGASGTALVGPVSIRQAAAALDQTRLNLGLGVSAPDLFAEVPNTPQGRSVRIVAPLDVTAAVAGRTHAYHLGDGSPLTFELRVPHARPKTKVRLVVEPAAPVRLLTPPPGTKTWSEAVRIGRIKRGDLLERVSIARLSVARSLQYESFLASPDPRSRSRTTYVYETTFRRAAPAPRPTAPSSNDGGPWRALAIAAIAIVGAGGLVVLWAHS